ncbi:MAG: YIP1 family protein [SAR202 cluster bacterium]|nr:YIP1 family protein [SAR202 cluster bacterium]
MIQKIIQASVLNTYIYEEISNNSSSIFGITYLVIFSGICLGFGVMSSSFISNPNDSSFLQQTINLIIGISIATSAVLAGWIIWSGLIYISTSKLLRGTAKYRQTLRAIGISYGPGILFLFTHIQIFGFRIFPILGAIWILLAAVFAVHTIQKIDWLGTILSVISGWVLCFYFLPALLMYFL